MAGAEMSRDVQDDRDVSAGLRGDDRGDERVGGCGVAIAMVVAMMVSTELMRCIQLTLLQ